MIRLFYAMLLCCSTALAAPQQSEIDAAYLDELSQIFGELERDHSRMVRAPERKKRRLNASEQLAALLDAHWAWQMRSSPESATVYGFPGQDERWSWYSVRAAQSQKAMQAEALVAARSIARDKLSASEQLNLDLFIDRLATDVRGHSFPEELLLVNQMYGVHTSMARTLANMPLFTPQQIENYLARLAAIPQVLQQSTETLREGVKLGITPPRVTLQKVPAQAYGLAPESAMQSVLITPLQKMATDISDGDRFVQRAESIYEESVRPAVIAFAKFLEDEYLAGAVEATGLSTLPDGRAWYQWRVQLMTTTDLTPQQIHEIGLAEVERIQGEMFEVMDELGFNKHDIPAFSKHLAKDSSQFYTRAADMLRDYRAKAKRADAQLVRLFGRYPTLPYAIEAIPAHEAAGRSGAYYFPGSAKNGRPGTFFVNTSRLSETPKYEMEALLLHEAVPGHHFQVALTQDFDELPPFRRYGRITAYTEGWGLYAESLGYEMDFYQSPEARFGALSAEMWRAIRLVVDTGMHALGWSRQQAIEFFVAYTGRSLNRIQAEVDRYLVMPGQALAYKMGELRFKALRNDAKQALGDQFDLRQFHDQLLSDGALPLSVLEKRMNDWVMAQKMAQ